MMKHIVVATDFSPSAARAVDAAADLATAFGAKLTVVHAFEIVPQAYPFLLPDEAPAAARREVEQAVAELRRRGLQVDGVVRQGSPSYEIVSTAERLHADLLVVGSHGWRGFNRLLLGSVAERVVRASSVPVLTVHGWRFEDLGTAGERLGSALSATRADQPSVLALTPAAAIVGAETARCLGSTLDLLLTRRLELAGRVFGGISERGAIRLDAREAAGVAPGDRERVQARAFAELRDEALSLRGSRWVGEPWRRTVVLVSEGLTNALPALAAVDLVREMGASRIVVAAPVAAPSAVDALVAAGVETVALEAIPDGARIEDAYRDFANPSARAVREALEVGMSSAFFMPQAPTAPQSR